jgi:hypothetical protein
MYWFRAAHPLDIGLYILLTLAWAFGGWLLAAHSFRLRPAERLIVGIATGMLLFITLSVGLSNLIKVPASFWAAGLIVLGMGVLAAWRGKSPRVPWSDFYHWPSLVWLAGLGGVFVLIQRGVSIFDDFVHLPLVSVMAGGDLPPRFFLNPSVEFGYHLGLQTWAASAIRLAGMTPWSGWDLAKGFALALCTLLAFLWARRWLRSLVAAAAASLMLIFGGGSLWLLLLMPHSLLVKLSNQITLINTGEATAKTLAEALTRTWVIEGADPIKFPFAFQTGTFTPIGFIYGLSASLPYLTLLVLLLLISSKKLSWMGAAVLTLIFASLALSAEFLYPFLWISVATATLLPIVFPHGSPRREALWAALAWWGVLVLSGALALTQGGAITVRAHDLLLSLQGIAAHSTYTDSFSLRWPPGIYTAFTGTLHFNNPAELVVLLTDLGPAVLLGPLAIVLTWRWLRSGRMWMGAFGLTSLGLMAFPIFVEYGVDRSITRMPNTALWMWLVIGLPALVYTYHKGGEKKRLALGAAYGVLVLGGLVTFCLQIPAIQNDQLAYFIEPVDAQMSRLEWNRLAPGDQVIGLDPTRTVTVFGRATTSSSSIYEFLPEWPTLVGNPDPVALHQAGYAYIYMDQDWWKSLASKQQQGLTQPCVKEVARTVDANGIFRALWDIRTCH